MISKPKFSILGGKGRAKEDVVAKPVSALTELPSELKQRVASFLSVSEIMKLTETSKSIRSDLDLTVVSSPLTDRASQDKVYQTLNTQQCFATVVPNQESLPHSMTFCCDIIRVKCNGSICIKEHNLPVNQSADDLKKMPFRRSKVAATSSVSYAERRIVLSFHPKPNKYYQFWIRTDGYDDDEDVLRFENMRLYRTGFGANSMDYTAYQYDVKVQRQRRRGYAGRGHAVR
mmetsp:Transcript_14699/g.35486  ORF Transcript_14699/g.35486 Transcript_14699/m.35486 type:complete len:231 (-) Transcript_14699:121-813(-)